MSYSGYLNRREKFFKGRESTFDQILDGAIRLISVYGIHGVTIEKLMRETGFTRPTLYNYFTSKEIIINTAIDKSLFEILEELENPNLSPQQKILLIVECASLPHFDAFIAHSENASLAKVMFHLETEIQKCQQSGVTQIHLSAKDLAITVAKLIMGKRTGVETTVIYSLLGFPTRTESSPFVNAPFPIDPISNLQNGTSLPLAPNVDRTTDKSSLPIPIKVGESAKTPPVY